MTGHHSEWVGRIFFSAASIIAILMSISPRKFFGVLGMREDDMSARQVMIYRWLGVIMAAGAMEFVIKSFLKSGSN